MQTTDNDVKINELMRVMQTLKNKNDPNVMLYQARDSLARGNIDSAINFCRTAIKNSLGDINVKNKITEILQNILKKLNQTEANGPEAMRIADKVSLVGNMLLKLRKERSNMKSSGPTV